MASNELLVQSSLQSVPTAKIQKQGISDAAPTKDIPKFSTNEIEKNTSNNPVADQQAEELERLREKVVELNSHMQTISRNLHFSVDETSGYTVVKVINAETEELVRQIPTEDILQARNAINEFKGLLLETKI